MSQDSLASVRSTDTPRALTESQHTIKVNGYHLKKADPKDHEQYVIPILQELRHSHPPKDYYELYSEVFDLMQTVQLSSYEQVQYCTQIIPRLYMMVTIGSKDRECLSDILEMCKGVQHPLRGLFLRYYLQQMTRSQMDKIPIDEAVEFLLINFTEMNKLWVRMQYQGPMREKSSREAERKELKLLVGLNLVRMSSLDGMTVELYKERILPRVLEQVVSCKDVIAQEYLMEALAQVFSDEYHLATLEQLLGAVGLFNPDASVRSIIVAFVDRLVAYSKKPVEETNFPEDLKLFEVFWKPISDVLSAREDLSLEDATALLVCMLNLALNCHLEEFAYTAQVLEFAAELYAKSPVNQLTPYATKRLIFELLKLPLDVYPSLLTLLDDERLSKAYGDVVNALPDQLRLQAAINFGNVLLSKAAPLTTMRHINTVFGSYQLSIVTVEDVEEDAQNVLAKTILLIKVNGLNDLDAYFVALSVVKDILIQGKGINYTLPSLVSQCVSLASAYVAANADSTKLATLHKFVHQQTSLLARQFPILALKQFLVPLTANLKVGKSPFQGHEMAAYEFFVSAFSIYEDSVSSTAEQLPLQSLFINTLYEVSNQGLLGKDNFDTLATKIALYSSRLLRKWDQARFILRCSVLFWGREPSPYCGAEHLEPEPLVETMTLQFDEANLGGGWGAEASPASPIQNLIPSQNTSTEMYRDPKRVLECLQKALKVADSCMDTLIAAELFVDILAWYIYWYSVGCQSISAKYLNGLVDLAFSNIEQAAKDTAAASLDNKQGACTFGAPVMVATDLLDINGDVVKTGQTPIASIRGYFLRTLEHLQQLKNDDSQTWSQVTFESVLQELRT